MTHDTLTYRPLTPLDPERDRHQWLLQRRTGLGSSDASVIFGLSQYESPYSLWELKTGRAPLDPPVDERTEELRRWGNLLEPVVRDETAHRIGMDIHKPSGAYQNTERTWQIANLDGITADGRIAEFKTTHFRNADQWVDQIPDAAEIQVHHAAAVTGMTAYVVAGLIGGNELRIWEADINPNIVDILIEEEAKFWQYVQSDTPPPADGHLRTLQTLTKEWAHKKPAKETDDPQVELWWRQWAEADEELKAAEDRKREAVANLAVLMDGHDELRTGERVWARAQRGQLDRKRLAAERPDLVGEFTRAAEVFDPQALKAAHPDIYAQFQGVTIRPKGQKP